jgi:hypothetical protein
MKRATAMMVVLSLALLVPAAAWAYHTMRHIVVTLAALALLCGPAPISSAA